LDNGDLVRTEWLRRQQQRQEQQQEYIGLAGLEAPRLVPEEEIASYDAEDEESGEEEEWLS
jgi:hypothetical protein